VRVFKNILIAVALLFGPGLIVVLIWSVILNRPGAEGLAQGLPMLAYLASSIWAAISSYRLEFRRYKTGLSYHPMTIFFCHLLLWIVVFPWFLTVRDRIKDGSAELKDEFKPLPSSAPAASRAGIPTPPVQLPSGDQVASPAVDLVPPPLPATRKPAPQAAQVAPEDGVTRPELDPVPPPLPARRPLSPATPPAVVAAPKADVDRLAQIQKLADFRAQGILTEEEFQAEKRRLLSEAL